VTERKVVSLRKSAALLQEAAEAWCSGRVLELPSECGAVQVHSQGRWTLVHQPPSCSAEVAAVMQTFWPGPLCLRLVCDQRRGDWWMPHHPLLRALLEVAGELRCDPPGQSGHPVQLRLQWKLPLLPVAYSHLDASSEPWRWLRSGAVERRAVEWVAARPTLLSE